LPMDRHHRNAVIAWIGILWCTCAAAIEPVAVAELEAAIDRGVGFLLESQRDDGSWGSADNTKGGVDIYAPAPGAHHAFRSAVTALCVSALVETGRDSEAVKAAIDRGERWLLDKLPSLRRATRDTLYNVWGHAYGIEALALVHARHAGDAAMQERIEECIRGQVELLERYESVDGGWGYYDFAAGARKPTSSPNTFTTATVLLALADARDLGIDVPQKLFDRGLATIHRQTKPDRSYLYGEYLKYEPAHPVNRPGGSLGRSQACNAVLRRLGDPELTDAAITTWLERLFTRNGWLDLGRKKPIPHESWFAVAGYFFFYGHFYAAECIEALPAA
jgi:mannose/cellobiose epimerase-like protein (N-acyl-D-glucosamine 2-epimerase family)